MVTLLLDPDPWIASEAFDKLSESLISSSRDPVKDVLSRQTFTPIGFGPTFAEMIADRPRASRWLRRASDRAECFERSLDRIFSPRSRARLREVGGSRPR
jgi:hypothetical protein